MVAFLGKLSGFQSGSIDASGHGSAMHFLDHVDAELVCALMQFRLFQPTAFAAGSTNAALGSVQAQGRRSEPAVPVMIEMN